MDNQARDKALDSLQWSGDNWQGRIQFLGVDLSLLVEFDTYAPTDHERQLAMASVKETLPRLTQGWEREARSSAAAEIIEAARSQSDDSSCNEDVDLLAAEMQLASLDFTYLDEEHAVFPCLAYSCPKRFPDMMLCIQFATDLTVEEVTLNNK